MPKIKMTGVGVMLLNLSFKSKLKFFSPWKFWKVWYHNHY